MNKRIKELFKQAGGKTSVRNLASNPVQVVETHELWDNHIEKFAELIVKDTINIMKQEWYDWNNAPSVEGETLRDVGLRVGAKSQTMRLMHMVEKHFGVEE